MSALMNELNSNLTLEEEQGVRQFLTFIMAEEEYGVDILTVKEIRSWEEITVIPNAPDYVQGVINIRGTIVPILDLRLRFGLPRIDYGALTVVIVIKVDLGQKTKIMGMVVDAVSDVYSIIEKNAKMVPTFTDSDNSEFVAGLVNVGEKMVALLDLKKTMDI